MTVHSYKVQRGESVRSVAAKFSVPEAALSRENETPFYQGQRVSVPVTVLRVPPEPPQVLAERYQVPAAKVLTRPDVSIIVFI